MDNEQLAPAGYKRTEVGVIPEDWEVKTIGEILTLRYGKSQRGITTEAGAFPVLATGGEVGRTDSYLYDKPSIIVGRKGTIDTPQYVETPFWAIDTTYYSEISNVANPKFVFYMFNIIHWYSYNEASGVPSLNAKTVGNIEISLPPLPEQRAIAEVLSDVDALIAALERLIAKKRAIKQGAMQQLLTGQTRLPGFSEPWEVKQLGEMGEFQSGNGFPTQYQGDLVGDYPFFKVSDMNKTGNETVMRSANNWITEDVRKIIGAKTLPQHSIVFAKIGAAIFLERKKLLLQESCIDNNMMGFIPDKSTSDYGFVQYLFLNIQLGKLVSTTALPYLSGKEIAELEYPFPELEEQRAIAGVLSDMDAEIAALEARRDKTRAIKQGVMQELLTGKTRLV